MSWETTFDAAIDTLTALAEPHEDWSLWWEAEDSEFARFNHAKVRQAGVVRRGAASVRWMHGRRHTTTAVTLGTDEDRARLTAAVHASRERLAVLPEDPLLLIDRDAATSSSVELGELPHRDTVVAAVGGAGGLDLVGIYASGRMYRGFASSFGHRHWFATDAWQLDLSAVHGADKAVKQTLGGRSWDAESFDARMGDARRTLEVLARPAKVVDPGRYRAWLTPAAMGELIELLAWEDLGARSHQTKMSALSRLASGSVSLHESVHLSERYAGSTAPRFQSDGFRRPDEVPLIRAGKHAGSLVSPRSAAEYGLEHTGADTSERGSAVAMAAGDLPAASAMAALDTGVWVSNLWYCNWSDRNAARITGMTRFATLWVENGKPVAPLAVMRFDDSLYDLLGSKLRGISDQTELLASTDTYGWRSLRSQTLPGILVDDFDFAL
jgi:predicted Zn-dependent protease